ncbi:hypothetical protein NQ176_g10845 [Zarea fungicola]|uniref:Uncharacterized protein n=1 Tax=Zarea fungicola TaxID=93591 RepID=A0ACC1MDA1_9HYPO|nr:hypothetical protein NQ176_g10845 [Lecanicillium fungicola]
MKSTFALIGTYAALASAYTPGRHLHFPRGNGTMTSTTSSSTSSVEATSISTGTGTSTSISAPLTTGPASTADDVTTLTVKVTHTSTIISCAATVTNCPAGKPEMSNIPESDRQTKTVTQTVDLTTTVCPVAEASSISKQIVEKHSSAAPSQTAGGDQAPKTTDIVSTTTVTMTLGSGNMKSVVPTVITSTYKSTITPEETITTTATSTTTKTVTITRSRTPANTAASESQADAIGGGSPSTVTVTVAQTTVTAPASTVYVTVPCAAASSAAPVQNKAIDDTPYGNNESYGNNGPSASASANASASGNDATSTTAGSNVTTQPPAESTGSPCESDVTTTVETTVTVVPYPVTNSTSAISSGAATSSGAAAPSGFAYLRR